MSKYDWLKNDLKGSWEELKYRLFSREALRVYLIAFFIVVLPKIVKYFEARYKENVEQQAKDERLRNPYSPGIELHYNSSRSSSPINTSELEEINDVMRSIDFKMGTYKTYDNADR